MRYQYPKRSVGVIQHYNFSMRGVGQKANSHTRNNMSAAMTEDAGTANQRKHAFFEEMRSGQAQVKKLHRPLQNVFDYQHAPKSLILNDAMNNLPEKQKRLADFGESPATKFYISAKKNPPHAIRYSSLDGSMLMAPTIIHPDLEKGSRHTTATQREPAKQNQDDAMKIKDDASDDSDPYSNNFKKIIKEHTEEIAKARTKEAVRSGGRVQASANPI